MTTPPHDNPADSRGVTVALAAFHHELATGAGSRLAMLAALRSVASLMKNEIADEAATIAMETVLEATAIANARVAELESGLRGLLGYFAECGPRDGTPWQARSDWVDGNRLDAFRAVLAGGEQE